MEMVTFLPLLSLIAKNYCEYEAGRNCKRNSPNVWSNDTDALFRLAFQVQWTSVFLCSR